MGIIYIKLNFPKKPTMHTTDTIDQATLVNLIEAGAVHGANVIGQPGGWEVVVRYGRTQKALSAKRGQVRLFRKLDTLDNFLRGIGLVQYEVDARQFDPQAMKAARTNVAAAERLKNAHEAVAYRNWLEGKVSAARAGMADGSNQPIPDAEWAAERAEWEREAHGAENT